MDYTHRRHFCGCCLAGAPSQNPRHPGEPAVSLRASMHIERVARLECHYTITPLHREGAVCSVCSFISVVDDTCKSKQVFLLPLLGLVGLNGQPLRSHFFSAEFHTFNKGSRHEGLILQACCRLYSCFCISAYCVLFYLSIIQCYII